MSLAVSLQNIEVREFSPRGMTAHEACEVLAELASFDPGKWILFMQKDGKYGEALEHYAMYTCDQKQVLFEEVFERMEENYLKRWEAVDVYRRMKNGY